MNTQVVERLSRLSTIDTSPAEHPDVEDEASTGGSSFETLGVECDGRVEGTGRIQRIVLVARHEDSDRASVDFVEPLARPGGHRQAYSNRHAILGERPGQGHATLDVSAGIGNAVPLGEHE